MEVNHMESGLVLPASPGSPNLPFEAHQQLLNSRFLLFPLVSARGQHTALENNPTAGQNPLSVVETAPCTWSSHRFSAAASSVV